MSTEPDDSQDYGGLQGLGELGVSPEPIGHMLILAPGDNVAVVVAAAPLGGVLHATTGETVETLDEVPRAHKVALVNIPRGDGIRKYGEIIGVTTREVRRGEHVHVHNVESQRLRGDLAAAAPGHLGAHDDE